MDVRLQRAIHLWQQAGRDPDDAFRGLYISDDQVEELLSHPPGTGRHHAAQVNNEADAAYREAMGQLDDVIEQLEATAHQAGHRLPLVHLREAFELSPFEIEVLLIAIAPSIDLRYERLYGYLQDDVTKKRPTVNLVLDLLAEPGLGRLASLHAFESAAPLVRHRLLELQPPPDARQTSSTRPVAAPLLAHRLQVDESLLHWLFGSYRPHTELLGALSVHQTPQRIPEAFLSTELTETLDLVTDTTPTPLYIFHGADADLQLAGAAAIAQRLGRLLMIVDLEHLTSKRELSPARAVELALRDARLVDALPILTGWDVCLVEETTPPDLLYTLTTFPGPAIVAGHTPWTPKGTPRKRPMVSLAFPVPSYTQRRRLWDHYLGQDGQDGSPGLLREVINDLAGQFSLTSGQIRDAVASARDSAMLRRSSDAGRQLTQDELFAAARAHSNPRLARLADKITPRFTWNDIILPSDQLTQLHEIVDTVRGRPQVLDAWGLAEKLVSSRGVTVLFSGPPGTGKTMAAQIIAGALGLDLYRIDLSTVVSKYIGETEKNIERIFSEAEASNAILFFDEADALFGKRSEVRDSHDRYANIEVSYLLQRMEAYDGVTILATNLRGNLDEAFTRRLQFAVGFPFPEAEERLHMWRTLFPPEIPRAPDIDLELLAERFRLSGGGIRNVLVSAAYLAAADGEKLTMEHLLHGTRRELQKMGRLVRDEDMAPS